MRFSVNWKKPTNSSILIVFIKKKRKPKPIGKMTSTKMCANLFKLNNNKIKKNKNRIPYRNSFVALTEG